MRRPLPPIEVEEHFSQLRQDLRSLKKSNSPSLKATAAADGSTIQHRSSSSLALVPLASGKQYKQQHHFTTGRSASCVPSLHTSDHLYPSSVTPVRSPLEFSSIISSSSELREILDNDEDSVESQRHALQTWIQNNAQEFSNITSNHVATELLLKQILAFFRGKNADKPNGLRLAAMCVVAESVVASIGNYGPILRVVLDELYKSVYMSFGYLPREELISSTLTAKGLASKQYVELQRFLTRKPFFESHDETTNVRKVYQDTLDLLANARLCARRVVMLLSDSWSHAYVRVIFCAWRGTSQRARNQTTLLTTYLTNVGNRDVLQSHFYAWRLSTKVTQLLRARELYSESIEQLVQQEAITNAKYIEADDQVEESRLKISRLKEEKDSHKLDRDKFQTVAETSMIQAEGWRKVTIETVLFLVSLREHMATPMRITGPSFLAVTEQASAVLLEWVHRMVGPLPAAGKVRMSNFGPDMKDGSLLVLLLHAVTHGAFDEKVLQEHVDVRMRIQLILDYLQTLALPVPFTIDDVCPPTHESNFLIVYTLWYFFESPVRGIMGIDASNFTSLFSGRFREDLETMNKFLENARSSYPKWLEQRSMLQQYASFVLFSQSKKLTVNLLSEHETSEREKELQHFSITSTQQIPAAFLISSSLSPTQKFQNNEELLRINAVIAQHVGVLRHVFESYSATKVTVEATVTALSKKKKPAPNQYVIPESRTHADLSLDEFAFFRLCADAGLVTRTIEVPEPKANAPAKPGRGGPQSPTATAAVTTPSAPKQFSKQFLFDLCQDITFKTASSPNANDGKLTSVAFVSLLVNLSVHRYGQPVSNTTVQQISASSFFETLIVSDLAAMANKATQRNAFLTELFNSSTQNVWVAKRGLLQWGYKDKCADASGNTMSLTEWVDFLQTHCTSLFNSEEAMGNVTMVFHEAASCLLPPASPTTPAVAPPSQTSAPNPNKAAASPEPPEALLVYGEFEIALAAVAVMMSPSPFMSLKDKLDRFLPQIVDSLLKTYQMRQRASESAEGSS